MLRVLMAALLVAVRARMLGVLMATLMLEVLMAALLVAVRQGCWKC